MVDALKHPILRTPILRINNVNNIVKSIAPTMDFFLFTFNILFDIFLNFKGAKKKAI